MSSTNMILADVYGEPESQPATRFLYDVLREREPYESISHRDMPSFEDHDRFVNSHPYREWFIIFAPRPVGSIYLTHQNEIGVFIIKAHQGHGYGQAAVRMLIDKYPDERFLANINPLNERSIKMFLDLGFELLQLTYTKKPDA